MDFTQNSNDIENIYAWRGENLLGFAIMEVRDFLKEFGHFKNLDNSIQPPWRQFENIDHNDMFWNMGKGEDFLTKFAKYYLELNDREKTIYKLTNPAPYNWTDFYN